MPKTLKLDGVITALITPFLENGDLDLKGLHRNIEHQIENGVSALVLLGTTGEATALTEDEQTLLIQKAVSIVNKRLPLLIGTGTASTRTTIEKTIRARDLGADAALIVTPYYVRPTQEGLVAHFSAIAKASSLPILLYNVPGRTGVNLDPESVEKLMTFPSIIGIKEATTLVPQLKKLVLLAKRRNDFFVFAGDDAMALPFIQQGAVGVISVLSNLLPKEIVELVTSSLSGKIEKAAAIHERLLPMMKGAFIETNPAPIKMLMALKGLPSGPVRLPLVPLKEENRRFLESLYPVSKTLVV